MATNSTGSGPPHGKFTSFVQDGPPAGGYAPINVKRNLPKGGPSSIVLASGFVFMTFYGFYKIIMHNRERREWRREEMDIRMSILPFMQAEADVQANFFNGKWDEQEREIMKRSEDYERPKHYKNTYMPPREIRGTWPLQPTM